MIIFDIILAIFGAYLLWQEAIQRRFRNLASTIFLLAYVPLLCIYPLIARMVVGGAASINPQYDEIIADPYVFLIFNSYSLVLLLSVAFLSRFQTTLSPHPNTIQGGAGPVVEYGLLILVFISVYLYIAATGLSVGDLITASRFSWFEEATYSSLTAVVSSYLLSLSPVAVFYLAYSRKWKALAALLGVLAFYALMSKDRKWLIFIASGFVAYFYFKGSKSITITKRVVLVGTSVLLLLSFWQIFRGVLFDAYISDTSDTAMAAQDMAIRLLTKGDLPYYFNAAVTAIDLNLNDDFSVPLGVIRRQIFFFLPVDYSFGLKPEDLSAIFSDAVEGGDQVRRGNMPPGLFGLFAISFEWWGGIFFAFGIPVFLKFIDLHIQETSILSTCIACHLFSSTLLLLRGDDSSATYFIIFSFVVTFVLFMLGRRGMLAIKSA